MRVNVLANGPSKKYFKQQQPEGELLLCNIPAYDIPANKVHGLCMTDGRFLKFLCTGILDYGNGGDFYQEEKEPPKLDKYDWILGQRATKYARKYPEQLKQFSNKRIFMHRISSSTGLLAIKYAHDVILQKFQDVGQIHIYGMDALFQDDVSSSTHKIVGRSNQEHGVNLTLEGWRNSMYKWLTEKHQESKVKFFFYTDKDRMVLPKPDFRQPKNIKIRGLQTP